MVEFLTWNTRNISFANVELGTKLILPFVVALFAMLVTAFLDKYGAPDDDVSYDPRYDRNR